MIDFKMISKGSKEKMTSKQRFIQSIEGNALDRPAVWMMRQAGRTLPEYNQIREKYSFWEICQTPELATKVTLQPLNRFPIDAAIIFSDILVIPSAMGIKVHFDNGVLLEPRIKLAEEIEQLKEIDVHSSLSYVGKIIELVSKDIGDSKAVLGFSGAPFTLATYMIEGGSSKNFSLTKSFMYNQPDSFHRLMDRLTTTIMDYLEMQLESGATTVQLFDTWASQLSPEDFQAFNLPYLQRIWQKFKTHRLPLIYYINGIYPYLQDIKSLETGILGIDFRVEMSIVRKEMGNQWPLQGNIDPAALFAEETILREKVFRMLNQTRGIKHIVNLGHGLLPNTPISGIECFFNSLFQWADQKEKQGE